MKVNPTTEIGKSVLAYLQDNPMSLPQFCKKSGLSITCIRNLLLGGKSVDFLTELKLGKFLKEQNQVKELTFLIKNERPTNVL